MKTEEHNAYHVKLKLIPKEKVYKSSFIQGIVFEKTPSLAEKMAKEKITEAIKNEPFEIEVKSHSIVRLRKDFIFYP